MAIESINPNDERLVRKKELDSDFSLESKVSQASKQFESWKKLSTAQRLNFISSLGKVLEKRQETLATTLTKEIGKPISQARAEVDKCAKLCRHYVDTAEDILADRTIFTNNSENIVTFQPLGPILGVMPWNFPFWQSMRFAIPALCVGNTVLLRLAENATECAVAMQKCFEEAEFPKDVFQTIYSDYKQTDRLLKNKHIKGFSFTGSTEAGKHLGKIAGENLKKTVLELGGSDPYIVLKDADVKKAAEVCVEARLTNNGQSCIAGKRFIVEEQVYDDFIDHFVKACESKTIGSPFLESTEVGPLAKEKVRKQLDEQVKQSIEMGAKLKYKSDISFSEGFFFPITVLTDVPLEAPVFKEETFGPVAAIVCVESLEEAIKVANDSRFGLGSAVFTEDPDLGLSVARELDSGMCAINRKVESNWELPFGGVNQSGFGRELGESGLKSFVNEKVIMCERQK